MRKPVISILVVTMLSVLAACTEGPQSHGVQAEPLRQVDLTASIGVDSLAIVGVTVEPGTQRVLVLDATRGLYALGEEGRATQVWDGDLARHGVSLGSAWTDIVALEEGSFALTALSDGYLLDLQADSLTQHFCYEPGWDDEPQPLPAAAQITDAVAYDAANGLIYAQPRTVGEDLVTVFDSNLALYDRATGTDLQWVEFDVSYQAGAMAMEDQDHVLLGVGSRVDRYTIGPNTLSVAADLRGYGVTDIQGMALDPVSGNLLVVDGPTQRLIEVSF